LLAAVEDEAEEGGGDGRGGGGGGPGPVAGTEGEQGAEGGGGDEDGAGAGVEELGASGDGLARTRTAVRVVAARRPARVPVIFFWMTRSRPRAARMAVVRAMAGRGCLKLPEKAKTGRSPMRLKPGRPKAAPMKKREKAAMAASARERALIREAAMTARRRGTAPRAGKSQGTAVSR
jgi:hypothetical protein